MISKKWSKDDVTRLRHYWQAGRSDKDIATRLGRTDRAVALKRSRLGLTVRKFRRTPDELARLLERAEIGRLTALGERDRARVMLVEWIRRDTPQWSPREVAASIFGPRIADELYAGEGRDHV